MANVFDIGLLNEFRIIFGWLFVFVIIYAALEMTKILGENKGLHGIFAFVIATLFAIQPNAVAIVTGSAPWFVVMIVIFMFMMLIARFAFGESKGDAILLRLFGNEAGAGWWIFVPVIIIIGMMIASTVGPGVTPGSGEAVDVDDPDYVAPGEGSTATTDYETNVVNTLFHPKVLGMVVLMIIALFTILTITGVPKR